MVVGFVEENVTRIHMQACTLASCISRCHRLTFYYALRCLHVDAFLVLDASAGVARLCSIHELLAAMQGLNNVFFFIKKTTWLSAGMDMTHPSYRVLGCGSGEEDDVPSKLFLDTCADEVQAYKRELAMGTYRSGTQQSGVVLFAFFSPLQSYV